VINGCTAVIRPKFSASRYWNDCIKHKCTVGLYIGEVCRYLLAQPEAQSDKQHSVRFLLGNGLRPHIWNEFVKRFALPKIGEFYGATEGNCSVMNTDNKVGAVGFMSLIAPSFYPVMLIKIDPDTGAIIRDSNGLCVQCGPGEIGHLVGKISPDDPTRRFDGYIDKVASLKKVVCNVLRRGDSAFLSGDLLERDDLGYLYFRDRTGDTFRWKGENVSTTEVEGVMMKALDNTDVVVYGVPVPGCEGSAGMAAIAVNDGDARSLNLSALYQTMHDSLPTYSVPLFLRLLSDADNYKTGTFKLKKTELQKDSFNKENVPDPILFIDNQARTFTELTYETYRGIRSGAFRF
jgi:solute carrier family 27 fatty acid transporter 1/4